MRRILREKRILEHAIGNTHDPALGAQLKILDASYRQEAKAYQLRCDIANLRQVEALSARQRYHEAWQKLRNVDRHRPQQQSGPFRLQDGRIARPSTELADALLDHFTAPMKPYCDPNADDETKSHWAKVEAEIAGNADLRPRDTIREPAPGEFAVTRQLLSAAVYNLKPFKAPGLDGIINIFYKWGGAPLQTHLRRLYNMCLASGFSIPAWKHAAVIPVPKPGKPASHVTSQRPISLLPTDAKLLESIVARWMTTHLEQQQLLPENQYAFRPHRSAPDIPLRVAQRVHNCRASHRKMLVVALDVQAAYDSVWHAGLAYKLLQLHLPRNLVSWLVDFLRDRKLQARVAGFLSREAVVNCGVPQGSPLSPLLYILYTADLLGKSSPDTETEAYADDLTISANGVDFETAQSAAQTEVNRISQWAQRWRQKFNATKSEAMPFSWTPTVVTIRVDGTVIPQVPVLRILGVYFDPRLTWRKHIEVKIQGCLRYLSWFRRLVWTPGLSRRWRRTAYIALLRTRLCYGNVAFSAASNRQLRQLCVFQNNCLRAAVNVRLRDRIPIVVLQQRTGIESVPTYLDKCRRKYIANAVQHVLPIREDVEAVRNTGTSKGPIAILNKLLPEGPLPNPVI
jgi:hypothetical protein